MKVILLRDVAKIGRRFEVKEVPGGHALNFLIPRKLAEMATPEALRRLEVDIKKKTIMSDRHDTNLKSALESLAGAPVVITLSANAQGHLFKGVKAADIATALEAEGVHVKDSDVVLEQPIKEVGEYTIELKAGGVTGTVQVHIKGA